MAHTGTPWTADEDRLLTQAVAIHGEADQWKMIALCVPGRTNKACRKVRRRVCSPHTHTDLTLPSAGCTRFRPP
jgi:hypothetical protein